MTEFFKGFDQNFQCDSSCVCFVSSGIRAIRLDNGDEWDKAAEPYAAYRERIKPELAREAEVRKATAQLLAASWDLLRAAEAVTSNALDIDGRSRHAAVSYELLNDLKAAIAKATAS